jgi:hypothetical protein
VPNTIDHPNQRRGSAGGGLYPCPDHSRGPRVCLAVFGRRQTIDQTRSEAAGPANVLYPLYHIMYHWPVGRRLSASSCASTFFSQGSARAALTNRMTGVPQRDGRRRLSAPEPDRRKNARSPSARIILFDAVATTSATKQAAFGRCHQRLQHDLQAAVRLLLRTMCSAASTRAGARRERPRNHPARTTSRLWITASTRGPNLLEHTQSH